MSQRDQPEHEQDDGSGERAEDESGSSCQERVAYKITGKTKDEMNRQPAISKVISTQTNTGPTCSNVVSQVRSQADPIEREEEEKKIEARGQSDQQQDLSDALRAAG